jgi:hypothetical protein
MVPTPGLLPRQSRGPGAACCGRPAWLSPKVPGDGEVSQEFRDLRAHPRLGRWTTAGLSGPMADSGAIVDLMGVVAKAGAQAVHRGRGAWRMAAEAMQDPARALRGKAPKPLARAGLSVGRIAAMGNLQHAPDRMNRPALRNRMQPDDKGRPSGSAFRIRAWTGTAPPGPDVLRRQSVAPPVCLICVMMVLRRGARPPPGSRARVGAKAPSAFAG